MSACLLFWLLCLLCGSMEAIKIGISHNENQSTTTTANTISTTTSMSTDVAGTTSNIDSTPSPLPEVLSTTPTQTFPPRKLPKKPPTTAPPTTPTPLPQSNMSTGQTPPKQRRDYRYTYCDCDLHADICEVNCCCDRDCSADALLVFDCLQSLQAPQLQTRLEDFQYTHGLPSCQLHDGWLCVFRSNTKPAKPQPLGNSFDAAQYNKWPEQLGAFETEQLLPSAQSPAVHYKFGQALQLWHGETKQVSPFELPMAFESAQCQLKQSLRHLEPVSSTCLMYDISQLQQQIEELINLTNSHQLLARPREDQEQEQDVAGIYIEVCQQLSSHLLCLEQGDDSPSDMLAEKIQLQLLHNFTHILKARLLLWEAATVLDETAPFWLTYEVVYKPNDEVQVRPSSGPLGYVRGAPLLFSTLQPVNNNSSVKQLSYYQHNSSMTPWLSLCHAGNTTEQRHAVAFGIDLTKQCQLRQLAPDLGNLTDYCQQLQAAIWQQLLPQNCTSLADLEHLFVSQLGRPQPSKWLPMQLTYADGEQVPPVQGVYNEEQQSLKCRNIFLSVSYEFFVAELTVYQEDHVPHQPVLQHARLVIGQRHDLEFDAGEQQVELPLTASVMFFWPQQKRLRITNAATSPPMFLSSGSLIVLTLFTVSIYK